MATINSVYTLLQSVNTKVSGLVTSVASLHTKLDALDDKVDALSTGSGDPALAARVTALENKPEGWGQ